MLTKQKPGRTRFTRAVLLAAVLTAGIQAANAVTIGALACFEYNTRVRNGGTDNIRAKIIGAYSGCNNIHNNSWTESYWAINGWHETFWGGSASANTWLDRLAGSYSIERQKVSVRADITSLTADGTTVAGQAFQQGEDAFIDDYHINVWCYSHEHGHNQNGYHEYAHCGWKGNCNNQASFQTVMGWRWYCLGADGPRYMIYNYSNPNVRTCLSRNDSVELTAAPDFSLLEFED